jgi:hypothetical protein
MKNTVKVLQDNILAEIDQWLVDNNFDEATPEEEKAIKVFIVDLIFTKLFRKTDKLTEGEAK